MTVELVIFDNDGVLVDSESHANRVLTSLLTEYGVSITFDECVQRFMGGSLDAVRTAVEPGLGHALPREFEARYHHDLYARFRAGLRPVPNVVTALSQLRTPTCVASSGAHERIRLALTVVGLWDQFAGRVFSRQDVSRGKPAPDLFLHAANCLGVAPNRCVVIEDTPRGIDAGNAAGMASVGYAGMLAPDRLGHATVGVIDDMADLPAVLDQLT